MPNKQLKKAERPKKFVISAFSRLMEEGRDYDKSAFYLSRQCLRDGAKALSLLGSLDGNVEFTPYLHLWKIGSEKLK